MNDTTIEKPSEKQNLTRTVKIDILQTRSVDGICYVNSSTKRKRKSESCVLLVYSVTFHSFLTSHIKAVSPPLAVSDGVTAVPL